MRTGKPWTKEEEEKLVNYFEEGKTAREISNKLGRNIGAIYQRRLLIGGYSETIADKLWTDKEKQELEKQFKQGKSDKEIAKHLGRTVNAITRVRIMMKLYRREVKHWTEEEDEKLKSLVRSGKKDEEIGNVLGRTRSAVANRKALFRRNANRTKKVEDIPANSGLDVEIEPLKKGQDYVLRTVGTGRLGRNEKSRRTATYKGKTDSLLVFDYEDYSETYTKVDVALGEVDIREATKTDYQTIQ